MQSTTQNKRGIDTRRTYRLLFNLLYFAGLRIGEALALCSRDFEVVSYKDNQLMKYNDLEIADASIFQVNISKTLILNDGKYIVREGTKNKKSRVIPLPPDFEKMFLDYMLYRMQNKEIKNDERIFPMAYETAEQVFRRCCEGAKIRRHKLHDFRHTYISNLVANNLPISDIAYFAGDLETTILQTYTHTTENHKIRLVETLEKL